MAAQNKENIETEEMPSDPGADHKERLIAAVKKEVKQLMEEAVTKKLIHEDSGGVTALCGAVEACLGQGLRRRALGLFKTNSTTALLHKIAKMVRNYKRKREKTYSHEKLLRVVELVKNKELNSYVASQQFNIPRSTIISHVYGTRGQIQTIPGKATVFSSETEKEIASYLHVMERCGFPLTAKEIKILVSEYVTPFKEDLPGYEWLRGFCNRNRLSLKKPQSVEIARKRACNPFSIYGYFDLLEGAMKELKITDKPERIYNLDKTSFCNDPSKSRVIGQIGYRSTRTTSSPGRHNTTVLFASNARGDKIPALIIFQGKHLWNEWCYKNQNVKTAYTVSEKGWMQSSIFEKYFRSVFIPAIGNERPVLLIYDGHSTHIDLNVIKLALSENITIIKLPPHSSDTLQPLDCSGMKPLKDRWEEALIKWQRLHVGAKLPKSEFAKILTQIWDSLNPVILANEFKKTGIYPLNRQAISKDIFDPLTWDKWEQHVKKLEQSKQSNITVPTLLSLVLKIVNNTLNSQTSDRGCKNCKNVDLRTSKTQKLRLPHTVEKIKTFKLVPLSDKKTNSDKISENTLMRFSYSMCENETRMDKKINESKEINTYKLESIKLKDNSKENSVNDLGDVLTKPAYSNLVKGEKEQKTDTRKELRTYENKKQKQNKKKNKRKFCENIE